jgi:hypothetical protein
VNIQTLTYDDTGVTDEERKAFMNGMETAKPNDIKRGSDGGVLCGECTQNAC